MRLRNDSPRAVGLCVGSESQPVQVPLPAMRSGAAGLRFHCRVARYQPGTRRPPLVSGDAVWRGRPIVAISLAARTRGRRVTAAAPRDIERTGGAGAESGVFSTSRILAPAGERADGSRTRAEVEVARLLARARRPTGEVRSNASALSDLVAANRILANGGSSWVRHVSARSVEIPERFFPARDGARAREGGGPHRVRPDGHSSTGPAARATSSGFFTRRSTGRDPTSEPSSTATPSLIPFVDSSVPLRPMYHMSAFLALGARSSRSATSRARGDARVRRGSAGPGERAGRRGGPSDAGHGPSSSAPSIRRRQPQHLPRPNAKMQAEAALGGTVAYLEPGDMRADTVDGRPQLGILAQQALARRRRPAQAAMRSDRPAH